MPFSTLFDHLETEAFSALGTSPIVWIDCAEAGASARAGQFAACQTIVAGFDVGGAGPDVDPAAFDLLLTARSNARRPWVAVADVARAKAAITAAVEAAPVAATTAARVLRINAGLSSDGGLHIESLAFSTLLGGTEFRRWRAKKQQPATLPVEGEFVSVERTDDCVTIGLTQPNRRNSMCAGMRDALHEALCAVLDDPTEPDMVLKGVGRCFSTGGDLAEFGTADDLATAHIIRTLRSCAARLAVLGPRATVVLHGACIGSGLEIAAAAGVRRALPGAFFQLPELRMGLLPGAGGTVSVARAIGRHRTCYMVLSGRRIGYELAVNWGLVSL